MGDFFKIGIDSEKIAGKNIMRKGQGMGSLALLYFPEQKSILKNKKEDRKRGGRSRPFSLAVPPNTPQGVPFSPLPSRLCRAGVSAFAFRSQ
uniref:Uncharacterized protein n=1 Tax=uncultured prokaryote TaxID=198431 RepID=A0A0H5Q385_9ZZZZ|nr:hypothetical protein [uncultured prokaryote]